MNAKTHSQAESLEDRPRGLQKEIWAQFRTVLRQELKAMLDQVLDEELRQLVGAIGVVSELATIREVTGPVNTTALLAINPSECYATTNFLGGDLWPAWS